MEVYGFKKTHYWIGHRIKKMAGEYDLKKFHQIFFLKDSPFYLNEEEQIFFSVAARMYSFAGNIEKVEKISVHEPRWIQRLKEWRFLLRIQSMK
jgi:hypothetical protein